MTDEELMLAVCEGDQSAYQTLVRQHLKSISHYAYRILGNRKDTEDITQEVFLKMWMNAAKWDPAKSKLTTWLHRIAHNLCIDHLRKHSRTELQDEIGESTLTSQEIETEHDNIELQQRSEALNSAISELPENQRQALMLCHYAGFSNLEAADIMNISVKALESNISRARKNLKAKLEQLPILRGDADHTGVTQHDSG